MTSTSLCGSNNKLPAGTYDLNATFGPAYQDGVLVLDCMTGSPDVTHSSPGSFTVDSSGNGAKTYGLPSGLSPNGPNDWSAVCVSDSSALYANQAPLTII